MQYISHSACTTLYSSCCDVNIVKNRNEVHEIFEFSRSTIQMVLLFLSFYPLSTDLIELDEEARANVNVQWSDYTASASKDFSDQISININHADFETIIKSCLESFIWFKRESKRDNTIH